MNDNKKYITYARDIGFAAVAQVFVSLMQFVRIPILTKLLGAAPYGIWSLTWTTIVLSTPLAMLGLPFAFLRYLAAEKNSDQIREGFWSVVFTISAAGLFLSLILIIFSDNFATVILGDPNSTYLVRLASLMIPTQALSQTVLVCFSTFRQMRLYSILSGGKAVLALVLMFWFLLLGWELNGVVAAILISDALCIFIAFVVIIRQIGFQFPKFTEIRTFLRYGLPLVPTAIILWVIQSSDKYIIGHFMEAREVGIYSAAYGLASVLGFFLNPVGIVLFPAISKSYDDGELDKTRTYLKYSMKYLMLLSIPCAFGISLLASPLLKIFTTSEFVQGDIAMPFIAFGVLFFGLYQICSYIILLVKKNYFVTGILTASAAINIVLNLLLVPRIGIIGAAIANLTTYAILGILTTVVAFKYLKFDLGFSFISKSILASMIMTTVLWMLKPTSIASVILSVFICAILYFAIVFALKCFNKSEIELAKSTLSRFAIRKD